MIGIVFAMFEEAQPYISRYGWKDIKAQGKLKTYKGEYLGEPCLAIVSGVGKVNATIAAADLIRNGADKIVNIGSCGANAKSLKVGDIVTPSELYDGDFDLSKFGRDTKNPYNLSNQDGLKCYTFSKFVTERVSEEDYVVEMECYSIACICDYFKVPFLPVKIVSDNANEEAVDDFDGNIDTVMEDSVERVEKLIKGRLYDVE